MANAEKIQSAESVISDIEREIAQHREAIARLEEQKVRANQRDMAKKHGFIGAAFARAEREGFVANTLFTQVVSKFTKPEDLEVIKESFPLDKNALLDYDSQGEGVLTPAHISNRNASMPPRATASEVETVVVTEEHSTQSQTPSAISEALSPEMPDLDKPSPVVNRVSKEKQTIGKVEVTKKSRQRRTKPAVTEAPAPAVEKEKEKEQLKTETKTPEKKASESKAPKKRRPRPTKEVKATIEEGDNQDFTAPKLPEQNDDQNDEGEEGQEDQAFNLAEEGSQMSQLGDSDFDYEEEDHAPIPGGVFDTRLALEDIDQFGYRMRLVNTLNSAGVFTLGDIIGRTERDFSRLRGMPESALKQVKALLNELKMTFRKD